MKKNLFILITLWLISGTITAQVFNLQWDARFGGSLPDQFDKIIQTSDNGFLSGGTSSSTADGDKTQNCILGTTDFWIVKTNETGVYDWDFTYGGNGHDALKSLIQTTDGGYLLAGTTESDAGYDVTEVSRGSQDYWMVKLNSTGQKEWDKRFGGSNTDYLYEVKEIPGGGYILTGYSFSDADGDKTQNNVGNGDYWVIKTDNIGNKIWDKDYGGNDGDFSTCLDITGDGGFIIGGRTTSDSTGNVSHYNHGGSDFWIVKLNSDGTKLWDKVYGGMYEERMFSIIETNNGGLMAGGNSDSPASGNVTHDTYMQDFWVVKMDASGNIEWEDNYGGGWAEEISAVEQTSDGNFLVSGDSYSQGNFDKSENNLGVEQAWAIKIDTAGNKLWDKTIFSLGHDEACLVKETHDGCYIAGIQCEADTGGYKTQPSQGAADYWMVKFCMVTAGIATLNNNGGIEICPNPSSGNFQIEFSSEKSLTIKLELLNALGEKVVEQNINSEQGKNNINLNTAISESGIYFLRLTQGENYFIQKVIIQK